MELTIRAANGTLAHMGEAVKGVPTGEWAMEPKYDGWWLAAHVQADKVTFYARSGNTYNGRLNLIEAELLAALPPDTWLAGEAVALTPQADGKFLTVWGDAQSVLTTTTGKHPFEGKITYMVFDLIAHAGIDARTLGYAKRRELLEKVFAKMSTPHPHVSLTPSFPATFKGHVELVTIGFEGSMLKRLDAPFASGKRGHGLAKWKHEATEDLVVMGFEKGKDVGAVVLGQFKDGKLVKRTTAKRKPALIPTPDLSEWYGKVIEIKHNGVMPGTGALRHPSMERVREDKGAEQCLWT